MDAYDRTLAYLEKLPTAVSGSGGHNATLRAACECFRFGLTRDDAWAAMTWFNRHRCDPAWSEAELRHKLADAEKIVRSGGQYARRADPRPARKGRAFVAPKIAPRPKPVYMRSEAEEDAWWAAVCAERGMVDPQ